ncbi:fumarylacetoacetate hydrolase family protein [Haloechinothrix sp. YIM 98757]|uniref:Fumarylacetoacetate hydrolase family protein n=2 Tax=Haloechinothrix aidingensis TaxID=2752311 RepID=A0A838ABI6_9PSEU|nr:fumarylacetoacetate hydrolase family protein [Haloechinothrix aidingensis]
MLDEVQRACAADFLWCAERDRAPIEPLRLLFPGIDASDAYAIQLVNIRRRLAAGRRVVGHKVGLSSAAMQRMMGVDEPDYGHLLDDMELGEGAPVPLGPYCYPRIEVEVGFVLAEALPGEGCTERDVLAATEAVVPGIELIDSRIRDWEIGIADTIADNASSAGFVLGARRMSPHELDLTRIDAALYRGDGSEVTRGRSDAVLGNPAAAVAWLARTVAAFGVRLEAGHIVLPGSCTRAVDVSAGDTLSAEFTGLGTVRMSFV